MGLARAATGRPKVALCGYHGWADWYLAAILSAAFMGGGDTIFVILAKVMSPFAGPLLGMFLLGMLSKRATSFGVIAGAVVGAAATVWVTYFTKTHWMWYFVVGCMVGLGSGYFLSLLVPARERGRPAM